MYLHMIRMVIINLKLIFMIRISLMKWHAVCVDSFFNAHKFSVLDRDEIHSSHVNYAVPQTPITWKNGHEN